MNYSTKVSSKDNAPPLNHSVFYKREFESNIMFFHLQELFNLTQGAYAKHDQLKLNETFQLRHIKICNSAYICTSNMNFKIRLKHFSYNFEASRNKILSQMSLNLK